MSHGGDIDLFSCRIINYEYTSISPVKYRSKSGAQRHIAAQTSRVTRKPILRSPVVRIFGPTLNGDNACINVHGVYPYFYVDWPDRLNQLFHPNTPVGTNGLPTPGPTSYGIRAPDMPPFQSLNSMFHAMAYLIDNALTTSNKTSHFCPPGRSSGLVFDISVVLRRSIYGFESGRRPFLLIQVVDFRFVHEVGPAYYVRTCVILGHA